MFVHTAHGRGRVIDEQSVRGRKSFLVEGSEFKVWVDEKDLRVANDVNDDNSTTLPYDPTPQHPTDMFAEESTLQPINEVDADERLSPADSLTFENESLSYPGPSADNFARQASFLGDILDRISTEWDEDSIKDWVRRHDPHGSPDEEEPINFVRNSGKHDYPGKHGLPDGTGNFSVPHYEDYVGRHRRPPGPEIKDGDFEVWDSRDWREANPDPYLEGPNAFTDPREIERYQQWQDKYLGQRELFDKGLNIYEPIYQTAGRHSWPDGEYVGRHRREEYEPVLGERAERFHDLYDFLYNASAFPVPGITAGKDCCDDMHEDEDDLDIKHFSSRTAGGLEEKADHPMIGLIEDAVSAAGINNPGPGKKTDQEEDDNDPDHKLRGVLGEVESLADDFAGDQNKKQVGGYFPGRPDSQTITSALYERPAGLSDRYIRVAAYVDHYSDAVQQFRDDPVGFIQKRGYVMSDSVDIRLAEYIDLVDHDPDIRTAAWKDVRSKALRLRREGRVHVKDLGPNRIYANVEGDSDTYETMILKGAGNDQSISDWHCSCPWGRWAFKRQMSYVGRLCSHGYASYLEMESQQMKANNKRRKSAGIVEDFKQWAENENDGMIDQQAIDNYIYLLNSQHDGDHTVVSEEDAEKLYDALDGMKSTGKVRDYDVDYLERPGDVYKDASFDKEAGPLGNFIRNVVTKDKDLVSRQEALDWYGSLQPHEKNWVRENYPNHYVVQMDNKVNGFDGGYRHARLDKEADVLALRPQSLTPDFYFVEDGQDGQFWTDVTKDERKTTGPDNMVKKSRRLTGRELHYASDDELFDRVKDWAGTSSKLEHLRELSGEKPDLQNKREQNEEIREIVDELHDRGIDASQFVASLRFAGPGHDHGDEESAEDDDKKTPASQQNQPDMSGKPSQTGQPGGSSSVPGAKPSSDSTPSSTTTSAGGNGSATSISAGPTNELSGQSKDPASVGFNGGPAATPSGPRRQEENTPSINIDPSEIMSTLGQAAGGFASAIPSIMYAIPSVAQGISQIGSGLGSGISNLVSGLGSGLGKVGTPIGGFPNVQLTNQESFAGSGPNPKYWMGSSECYVDDHERDRFVDLTDLDDDPIIKYTGDKPKQGPKKTSRSRRPLANSADSASVDNANPETSTLTSGSGMNDSMVVNFDQVRKAGSNDRPWDGHRIRDFRRFVQQNGSQISHQALQEYLSKPRRGLEQGSKQHLQDYVSYAEQHEPIGRQGRHYYAEAENSDLAAADIPGASDLMPDDPSVTGMLTTAAAGDGSDIVANFHRMGGIEAINNSGGGGNYSDSAIADQARGFLRTAGRMYSLAEQRELENEFHPRGARNLNELDLAGTHYEDAL